MSCVSAEKTHLTWGKGTYEDALQVRSALPARPTEVQGPHLDEGHSSPVAHAEQEQDDEDTGAGPQPFQLLALRLFCAQLLEVQL